ncbi:MAG: TonB C-terminal domain-containing protein [Arcicella sp.]|nr:TonB C-terminal domain-containing protein [Arcicella sp.]
MYELTDFNEVYEQSYNFIEEKFSFPKKQKGDFNVFFVIDEKGMLKNVAIKSSSDSNYNNALLQAVYATRQLWKAAQYQERNVEVQFNYVFKYEDTEEEDNFDYMSYQNILDKAERFYQKKEYVKAIKLYTKCILMKDDYLEPIYKRADSYFAVKSIKNACLDWSYLAKKGQKKAENLFLEHCMK